MNTTLPARLLALFLSAWMSLYPMLAVAEDISIFVGSSAGTSGNPNVLLVLDNTSNWARSSQKWPGGIQQGQAEVSAIMTTLFPLQSNINVGLMEFVTEGNANDQGGFIRRSIQPLTPSHKTALNTELATIHSNITSPGEKRNSNTPYGDLLFDVFNYYAGNLVSKDGSNASRDLNPPNLNADSSGYSSAYSQFLSPLSTDTSCARNFLIFIGNPNASGPASDSAANTSAMSGLGCTTTPLALPTIGSVATSQTSVLGNTSACYASTADAQTAYGYGLNTADNIYQLYATSATATDYRTACADQTQGCIITGVSSTPSSMSCPSGQSSYRVIQTAVTGATSGPIAQTATTSSANSTVCYPTSTAAVVGVAAGDHAGLTCPGTTSTTVGNVTTTTTHTCTWSLGSAYSLPGCIGSSLATPIATYPTTSCTETAPAAPTISTPATSPSFSACPADNNCAYNVTGTASTCSSPAIQTGVTGYLASAPTPTSPATASSVSTSPSLSCDAGRTCTYSVSVAATAPGGGDTVGSTTDYYFTPPSFSQLDNSLISTPTPRASTNLTCPAYNLCTYTTGAAGAGGGSGFTDGSTTLYYASPPTFPSIDNTASSSATAVAGTNLSCPANASCSYVTGAATPAPSTGTTFGVTTNYTTTAPTFLAITYDPSGISTSRTGTNLSCPPYNNCTYTTGSASGVGGTTGTSTGTTSAYYTPASPPAKPNDIDNTAGTSAVAVSGTTLSCPAHSYCSYSSPTQKARTDTSSSSGWTNSYTASAPTTSGWTIDNSTSSGSQTESHTSGLVCPPYASCSYTSLGTTHASRGANATTSTFYAWPASYSSSNCASVKDNSASGSAWTPSVSCDLNGSATCAAGQICDYTVTSGSPAASLGTSVATNSAACTGNPDIANNASNSTTNNAGSSAIFVSIGFTNEVGGTTIVTPTLSCGARQHCVYTTNATMNCPTTGKSINVTQTGLTPYTVTATPRTPLAYQWNISQTVTAARYQYEITQTSTAAYQWTVTQSATSAASTYAVRQTAVGATNQYSVTQTATPSKTYTITQTPVPQYTWNITQTATPQTASGYSVIMTDIPSVTTTTTTTTTTDLGQTGCYASAPSSDPDYASQCSGAGVSCTYNTGAASTTTHCASGTNQYVIQGTDTVYVNAPTGTTFADTKGLNADEWSRCLYQQGVPITGGSNQTVTTYTIDVYNAQPNALQTSLLTSMAKNGGGKYFAAKNETEIVTALKQIVAEIQSVNSTFASASLPINATNRSQNENQVFIGMFRPDPQAKPRWFGNLKRYQLVADAAGDIQLGDVNGALAINNNTGFVTDCATSWWTTDSSTYWSTYPINPSPAGTCTTSLYNEYSDMPDGPRVEKGAVAEVIRRGNNPSSPSASIHRTLYSYNPDPDLGTNPTKLQAFSASVAALSTTTADWVKGYDTEDEDSDSDVTEPRASIHGDVVHSRPLPVNYCLTNTCANTVVYYGANDGTLRAVQAETGVENWAFVGPEFTSTQFERLRTQTPVVNYPNIDPSLNPLKRNYFFDGSIGLYQSANNDKVWIYPTMRRGGRQIYALDVTAPTAPKVKWRFGCPNLDSDADCSTDAASIGQTWSMPVPAFLSGYSTTTPLLVVGGGYHDCEDDNMSAPDCSSTKGNVVFILNADTGALIRSFPTLRSVAADVGMIDMNGDGYPDLAYAVDTGGNIYRINFSTFDAATRTYTALDKDHWVINRVAYTGGGRKFLYTPALFGSAGSVYLALGSGDREHPLSSDYPYGTGEVGDLTYVPPVTNRFFVYRDCLAAATATSSLAGGDSLDDTTKMNDTTTSNLTAAQAAATCNDTKTLPTNCSTNKGWFTDLNNGRGEQTVTSAVITGGMVTFSTNRPMPPATGTCSTSLGEARGYFLNVLNGSGAIGVSGNCGSAQKSTTFVGGGLPPSPVLGRVKVNGKLTNVLIGAVQKSGSASSPISPQKTGSTASAVRKRVYTNIKGID